MSNSLKKIFSTPGRIIAAVIACVAIIAAVGTASVFAAHAIAENKSIGSDSALSAALDDAGITADNANVIKSVFERDDGRYVFDVEFTADGQKYEYLIDAKTGAVLERDVDMISSGAQTPSQDKDLIGIEAAKQAALEDAGVSADDAIFTKEKTDIDDGQTVYDLEFYVGNTEYDYEIIATTGQIKDKSIDSHTTVQPPANTQTGTGSQTTDDKAQTNESEQGAGSGQSGQGASQKVPDQNNPFQTPGSATSQNPEASVSDIGEQQAKQTALSDAGVSESDVVSIYVKTDYDDRVKTYDVKFMTSDMKYDYEIIASTGKIVEKDAERYYNGTSQGGSSEFISVDKAKNIAADHAGLQDGSYTFSKSKLEEDDGMFVYEIEFFSGFREYEYTINAVTGAIVDFEIDTND